MSDVCAAPADIVVNGRTRPVAVRDGMTLLEALRDEFGLYAAKDGCAPDGDCGACTVLVGGRARRACKVDVLAVGDREVTTLEGLPSSPMDDVVRALAEHGAIQCGFCTPGIVMRAVGVLSAGARPGRDEWIAELRRHLCRCTGYTRIAEALAAATAGVSGTCPPRYRASDLARGRHRFVADLRPPGLAYGSVRLADHARAEVLRIDTTLAAAMPGVLAVLTAADVPGSLTVGVIEQDWPIFVPEGGRTSYLGDVLALVIAEHDDIARAAARRINVTYEVLDPVTDPAAAMRDDRLATWCSTTNILHRAGFRRGMPAGQVIDRCPHVVQESFRTQRVEHGYLEPEAALAEIDEDGRVVVYSSGQGIYDDRRQVAAVLGRPESQVKIVGVASGGAFGGKEDLSVQAHAALAAQRLGRPVRCVLTRSESILLSPKRHPFRIDVTAGADANGRVLALRAEVVADTGPYASLGMPVLEWAVGHMTGAYSIPNVEVSGVAVRTNNPVSGAFRGFGVAQAIFAVEGTMDRLAEAVGCDGFEIRRRNLCQPGQAWGSGQRMSNDAASAAMCLDALEPHARRAQARGECIGVALAVKNSGLGDGYLVDAHAAVSFRSGRVRVEHGFAEMGQGVNTVAAQVAAECLRVPFDAVDVVVDTDSGTVAGQTTGSRTALAVAGAVRAACAEADRGGRVGGRVYRGTYDTETAADPPDDAAVGTVLGRSFAYAAQLVSLDPETGQIRAVVAAHDVGHVVNEAACRGQVEGAVHMGLGYALSENLPCNASGRPLATRLSRLGMRTPAQMPLVDVILLEEPDSRAVFGIKGIGEAGLLATAPAVAAALRRYDGIWRARLPMGAETDREGSEG